MKSRIGLVAVAVGLPVTAGMALSDDYGRPNKIMAAQGSRLMPLRITEMRYFVHEHSELPRRVVQDNLKVKSFSNCDSCHQRARQGLYDEHHVRIPGFGRWDD